MKDNTTQEPNVVEENECLRSLVLDLRAAGVGLEEELRDVVSTPQGQLKARPSVHLAILAWRDVLQNGGINWSTAPLMSTLSSDQELTLINKNTFFIAKNI